MKKLLKLAAVAATALSTSTAAIAADWTPPGPIKMIIAFAAGGGADTQARLIAEELEALHGWKIIPEQVTGKGGLNAVNALKDGATDGTVIGMIITETLGYNMAAVETKIEGAGAEVRTSYSRYPEIPDEQLREVIANTYGQLSLIDHSVGRIIAELETQGLANNTYIVYTADHGDWLGDHGLVLKGPMPFEGLLNVRAIVKGPDVPAGKVSFEPLSTLDLGATFMDWAGADSLMDIHGHSMRDVISGDGTRDAAMSEWELLPGRVGVGLSLRTVRSKTAKLTIDLQSGAGEMYDLESDPHELCNVFDDPDYASMKTDLSEILMSRPNDMRPNQVPVGMA
ncbi:sulfatase-like hydrolase/transferase [Shimia thalassica]|uniref:sulfatase-like hydrolase/transferase n=1 Tax=Shimia thalassica TaxID=1715693 RepID=UPI002494746E|nr:sulfatase-like hydrolase/transferase [Shimia thalassica]